MPSDRRLFTSASTVLAHEVFVSSLRYPCRVFFLDLLVLGRNKKAGKKVETSPSRSFYVLNKELCWFVLVRIDQYILVTDLCMK